MKNRSLALSTSIALLFIFIFSACASGPKLYPNERYKAVGKEGAEADIKACEQDADTNFDSGKGKQVARSAGTGAAVGGAIGGVSGLFGGNFGTGLLEGAAIGAAAGGTAAAVSPDELKREYINRCLAGKGYEVLGWD